MTVRILSLLFALGLYTHSPLVGAEALFNGSSLDGWEGDPKFWSVQDGAITGESTPTNPCKKSTYLAYTGKEFANFELTLSYRLIAEQKGNSGIQYRSQGLADGRAKGYQADLDADHSYTGIGGHVTVHTWQILDFVSSVIGFGYWSLDDD